MDLTSIFICPQCGSGLTEAEGRLSCASCGGSWPVRAGIACFAAEDEFYEGKFSAPTQDGLAQGGGIKGGVRKVYDRFHPRA